MIPWIRQVLARSSIVDVTNTIGGQRRVGRVRAWDWGGRRYVTGDAVPHLRGRSSYSVQTEEGWFVHVVEGRIDSWSKKPVQDTVVGVDGQFVHGVRARRSMKQSST